MRVLRGVREVTVSHPDLPKPVLAQETTTSHIPITGTQELNGCIKRVTGRHLRGVVQICCTSLDTRADVRHLPLAMQDAVGP
jgi:hypothetical protein